MDVRHEERVYRSSLHIAANIVLAGLVGAVALAGLIPVWSTFTPFAIGIAALVATILLWLFVVRVLLAGVHVGMAGVKIVNPFFTRHLSWAEIRGFGFGRFSPFFPRVGWAELTNGGRVMIWAIQGSMLSRENHRSRRIIEALNAELGRAANP